MSKGRKGAQHPEGLRLRFPDLPNLVRLKVLHPFRLPPKRWPPSWLRKPGPVPSPAGRSDPVRSQAAGVTTPTDAEAAKATVRGIRWTHGAARVKKAPLVSAKVLAIAGTPGWWPYSIARYGNSISRLCPRLPPVRAGSSRCRGNC
jgi:hypothetical protein